MKSFHLPVTVVTGDGCIAQLGAQVAPLGTQALLVCGASARASGTLGRALDSLNQAGVAAEVFDRVRGEPTLQVVAEGIACARGRAADVLVGLGGGSAMDAAKAIAGLAPLAGSPREYLEGRPLDGDPLPWVAIPTTSGTGAEVTMNAVLIDPDSGTKKSIRGRSWFAQVALVDPTLTLSLPPSVTAYTGADALTQAIESFVSVGAMPVTDALCRDAIRLIGRSLLPAYRDGAQIAYRRDLHYGSLMAGMALANARLGAVHGMAHPLGCHHSLPHGLVCGLLLPYVMEWNLPVAAPRYAEVASLLGLDTAGQSEAQAARAAVDWVRELLTQLGIPGRLRDAGVTRIDLEEVARQSMSSSMEHNPRRMTEEDVVNLLRSAL
ncbi:MAG: iron-containing alcohol dehydrogenase [Anaerolineae bacterium]|nr:iron-containing alcohol dehydrogenase [Anaerolineae bacterium]